MAKNGTGKIMLSSSDSNVILGVGTAFLTEFEPRKQIMLSKAFGNTCVEVVEVIDDNSLRIKKEFNKKVVDGIRLQSEGVPFKVRHYVIFLSTVTDAATDLTTRRSDQDVLFCVPKAQGGRLYRYFPGRRIS